MGTMEPNFTFGKKVTLVNILHVPKINKNLVSGNRLVKLGIKFMYESVKLILTRNSVFVGKGHSTQGIVKLYTTDNIINEVSIFTYMNEFVSLCLVD